MTEIASAFRVRILAIGMTGLLLSCGSPREQWQADGDQFPGVKPLHPVGNTTQQTLLQDFSEDPQKGAPLAIGLALSGGGPRAAMFSHGVLQGLNDSGLLSQVDAISSVSGGSYATLWFFTQIMEASREDRPYQSMFDDCVPLYWQDPPAPGDTDFKTKELIHSILKQGGRGNYGFKSMEPCQYGHFRIGDPYRRQVHLSRYPDLFRYSETMPDGSGQSAPWREAIHLAAVSAGELIVAPFIKSGALPSSYQYGFERTWALNPKPRKTARETFTYTNDTGEPQTSRWHLDPKKSTWRQLRALYNEYRTPKLPLWILNTTIGSSGVADDHSRIFEITPFGQGSELSGYLHGGRPVIDDLGTSVRASAAAVDYQGVNARVAQAATSGSFLFPLAEWGETVKNRLQKSPDKFHLSDGGHSENLGVYSLLRRGARDIVIVDSTQDIDGRMGDLCKLREMLAEEKVSLEFSGELRDLGGVCSGTNRRKDVSALGYNTSAWLNPVIPGTVTWPKDSGLGITRVWLIKLGWDERSLYNAYKAKECETRKHPVSCMVLTFYIQNRGVTRSGDDCIYFPQLTTPGAGYNSSTYLFWAYRELGRTAASRLKVGADGTVYLSPLTALMPQPALPARAGLRPENCGTKVR